MSAQRVLGIDDDPPQLSTVTLQGARNIAVQALAINADPNDASEVLDYALAQIGYQLHNLQRACADGLEDNKLDVALISLQERVEALQKFAAAFLDLRFAPLTGAAQ